MRIGYNIIIDDLNIYKHDILQLFNPIINSKITYINDNIKKIYIHADYKFILDNERTYYNIKNSINSAKNINNVYGIIIHFPKRHINSNLRLNKICNYISNIIKSYFINTNYKLILETDNNVDHIGSNIEDLEYIFNNISHDIKKYIRFCIDTSHIFLSGYTINNFKDMVNYFVDFELKIGINNIELIHLNDINSNILGTHTKHIAVKDGVIFNNENLNFILNLSNDYDIDIILERKDMNFEINDNEIKMIKSYKIKPIKEYLLYIILLKYFKFKIDIYNTLKNKDELNNLYKDFKSLNYINNKTIIHNTSNIDIKNIINNDYSSFKNIPKEYVFIKELESLLYFNNDISQHIYNYYCKTLEELKKLPLKVKRKFLTENQINSLKYYDKKKINIKMADKIVKEIDKIKIFYELYVLGSYYRYNRDEEININNPMRPSRENYIISDLDILFVMNNEFNPIEIIKDYFEILHVFIDSNEIKKIICKYKTYYIYIDLFLCKPEEKITYILFLKSSKTQNIILRKIAKNKGYKLNQKGLFKDNNKIHLENEKELFDLLKITYKERNLI